MIIFKIVLWYSFNKVMSAYNTRCTRWLSKVDQTYFVGVQKINDREKDNDKDKDNRKDKYNDIITTKKTKWPPPNSHFV